MKYIIVITLLAVFAFSGVAIADDTKGPWSSVTSEDICLPPNGNGC